MMGTKEGSTPNSDSQPSTWMRGPGLCAGLLGSREWEEGVADPLFSEAQEQSILFLRNVIVCFLLAFPWEQDLCTRENIKDSPRTQRLVAGGWNSVS